MSQITKLLFRRGTNTERLSAETIGVTFTVGEPAFTVDTKRLYVGDSMTRGGIPVGIRNLGAVNQLFGNFAGSGYSQEAFYILSLSGVEAGDILYDRDTRVLYTLTACSNFPPPTGEFVKYDFTVLLNPSQLEFNSLGQVQIKNEGVGPVQIAGSAVGGGLAKYTLTSPIQIANNGVENFMMAEMLPNSVKGNNTSTFSEPIDLQCGPKQFIGRSSTSTLTALDFTTILAESTIFTSNGVQVNQPSVTTTVFGLSTSVFSVTEQAVNIFPRTTISGQLSVVANTTLNANLNLSGNANIAGRVVAAELNTRNGRLNTGVGQISGGDVICRSINTQGFNISTGTGNVNCNNLFATGDVIAFFASDARLKENLVPFKSALNKVDDLSVYTFNWKPQPNNEFCREGEDFGLVAQEVQKVIPWAVQNRADGYYGIDYTRVVPYLLACIKELKEEIIDLKNEVRQNNK